MDRTNSKNGTPETQPGSRDVRYELIGPRGEIFGPYPSARDAWKAAQEKWPHLGQDEDRSGAGFDFQVAGIK